MLPSRLDQKQVQKGLEPSRSQGAYSDEVEVKKRAGSSSHDSGKCMVLDFYNITEQGPKSRDYLSGPEVKGTHVVGLAEHHIPKKGIREARNWCQQAGWRSAWSPAKSSGRSEEGTSGGTAVLSKKHLHLSPAKIGQEEAASLEHGGEDWTAIIIRLGGISILYIAAYFDCGIGVSGNNIKKMAAIMSFVQLTGLEFILMADFNMCPNILEFSGWAHKMGAEIIVPGNVDATCSTGSMLDYGLVSFKLKEAVLDFGALRGVPWKSHLGLRLRLSATPRSATVRSMQVPRRIREKSNRPEKKEKGDGGSDEEACDHSMPPLLDPETDNWLAQQEEGNWTEDDDEGIWGYPEDWLDDTVISGCKEEAEKLGCKYASWSRKLENYQIAKAGKATSKGCQGRGQFASFKVEPAFEKQHVIQITPGGREAQLWGSIASNLEECLRRRKKQGSPQEGTAGKFSSQLEEWLASKADDVEGQTEELISKDEPIKIVRIFKLAEQLRDIGKVSDSDVEHMAKVANSLEEEADAKRKLQVNSRTKKWVSKICDGHMKGAHEALKREENFRPDTEQFTIDGKRAEDMRDVMDQNTRVWKAKWTEEDDHEKAQLKMDIEEVRSIAKGQEVIGGRITGKDVLKSSHHLNNSRKLGGDHWEPMDWQDMPEKAADGLAEILNDMEANVTVPVQILLNIISLIPKPNGGSRPVCLASLLYVLWTTIRGDQFKDWDYGRAEHWDDAVKNSSALRAALRRRFLDECQVANGGFVAAVYWDIEKFYDSIRPGRVMKKAREQGIDIRILAIAMQVHLAPRVLRTEGCYGTVVKVSRSVLAGCRFSNAFARSVMYDILDKAGANYGMTICRQFVDDLSQNTRGKRIKEVAREAIDVSLRIKEGLEAEDFTISSKSVLVCSHKELDKEIKKGLRAKKIKLSTTYVAKDLGLDATSARVRRTTTQKSRIAKTNRRKRVAAWLRKKDRRAAKLYKSNLWPATCYGISGNGMANSTVRSLKAAAASVALGAAGQCASTAVAMMFGNKMDPEISARMTVIKDWVWLWHRATKEEKIEAAKTWMSLKHKLKGQHKWRLVKGPVGATIATLHDLGWEPKFPDLWRSAEGDAYEIHDWHEGIIDEAMEYDLETDLARDIWDRAAEHHNGSGLKGGLDNRVLWRHLDVLIKNDLKGKESILRKAACGAMWTRQRKQGHNLVEDSTCPRCGQESEDDLHRIWKCPHNDTISGDAVDKSKHLQEMAVEGSQESACFWLRGLVPKGWTQCPEAEGKEVALERIDIQGPWQGGTFYVDGSGGRHTRDARLRRCGWATIQTDRPHDLCMDPSRVAYGSLAGGKQTVPRAELTAVIKTLELCKDGASDVTIHTDCRYVFKEASQRRSEAGRSKNKDLWKTFDDLRRSYEDQGRNITILKVKAHTDYVQLLIKDIQWEDMKGNMIADAYARQGAMLEEVDQQMVKAVKGIDDMAWLIQERIIATSQAAMDQEGQLSTKESNKLLREAKANRRKQIKEQKEEKVKEKSRAKREGRLRLQELGHLTHWQQKGQQAKLKCSRCLGVCTKNKIADWCDKGKCPGLKGSIEGPCPISVNSSAWRALREWISADVQGLPSAEHYLQVAKDEVSKKGLDWEETSKQAARIIVDQIIKGNLTADVHDEGNEGSSKDSEGNEEEGNEGLDDLLDEIEEEGNEGSIEGNEGSGGNEGHREEVSSEGREEGCSSGGEEGRGDYHLHRHHPHQQNNSTQQSTHEGHKCQNPCNSDPPTNPVPLPYGQKKGKEPFDGHQEEPSTHAQPRGEGGQFGLGSEESLGQFGLGYRRGAPGDPLFLGQQHPRQEGTGSQGSHSQEGKEANKAQEGPRGKGKDASQGHQRHSEDFSPRKEGKDANQGHQSQDESVQENAHDPNGEGGEGAGQGRLSKVVPVRPSDEGGRPPRRRILRKSSPCDVMTAVDNGHIGGPNSLEGHQEQGGVSPEDGHDDSDQKVAGGGVCGSDGRGAHEIQGYHPKGNEGEEGQGHFAHTGKDFEPGPKVAEARTQTLEAPKVKEDAKSRLQRLRDSIQRKKDENLSKLKATEEPTKGKGVSEDAIGIGTLHPSHNMHHKRGIVWCWNCGAYVTENPRDLAEPCTGEKSRGRKGFLNKLKQDLPPRLHMDWPLREGEGPPEGHVYHISQ